MGREFLNCTSKVQPIMKRDGSDDLQCCISVQWKILHGEGMGDGVEDTVNV